MLCTMSEKWAIFDLFSLTAKVTAVIIVFPNTGLLRFLLCPKTQIMRFNKLDFQLKMPDCCLNLLFLRCGRSPPPPPSGGWV